MKYDFQVPYNTNIIFTRNLFFLLNVIFDVFFIKSHIFCEPLIVYFLNGYLDINYLTFPRLLMIIDKTIYFLVIIIE